MILRYHLKKASGSFLPEAFLRSSSSVYLLDDYLRATQSIVPAPPALIVKLPSAFPVTDTVPAPEFPVTTTTVGVIVASPVIVIVLAPLATTIPDPYCISLIVAPAAPNLAVPETIRLLMLALPVM
jgi:hypothetical protein